MKNIKTILRYVGLLLLVTVNNLYAGDLWVRTQNSTRFFLSIETIDNGLKLKHFSQEKGEYQSLISTTNFKNKSELEKYVGINYPNYLAIKSLPYWPVQNTLEKSEDKLFGKGEKNQAIWYPKNKWNDEWELKYAQWLQNEVTPDFYKKLKLATDCADAVVGLRWIFARMNSLPAANTIADTGNLFGHFSMKKEWRKYGTASKWFEDQLFMAALDYIMNLTSTRTIIHDGFPVKINREGLVPGTYIITQNNGAGHAKVISETHYEEITELPIYTLASTSPREVRVLAREVLLDQDWPSIGAKEILAFRWPVVTSSGWRLEAKDARPTYSLEQFDLGIKVEFPAFIQFVLSRVKESYDPLKLVELGINDVLTYANQRAAVVSKGYEYCRKNNCRPGTPGDEDWGTTSRDAKLLKKFHDIDTLVKQFENLSPGLYERWIAGLRHTTLQVEGVEITLASLRFIMENNLHSSLASDKPEKRWGVNASDLLTTWMDEIHSLLQDRNAIINRDENPCHENCFPKNTLWLGLNTYHIDAELNKHYVQVNTYCTLIASNQCLKFFSTKGQVPLTYNNETRTLDSWFKSIPYLHSDPRVSIDRRWGNLPQNIVARALPYFETIKVSKNSLALLDSSKLINLKDGKLLYKADRSSRVFLTDSGVVYKVSDELGEIKRLSLENGVVQWIDIADPDQLLQLEKQRPLHITENHGYTLFRKTLANSQIIFRIKDDQVEFIKEHNGITNQAGPLLTVVLSKNSMSLIDLDQAKNVDINLDNPPSRFNMNIVKISSYKYPHAVLTYVDQNEDQYYSVVVNLLDKSWTKLAPSINEKYQTLWSSAELKKALIQTHFNQEFPVVYAVEWDELNRFSTHEMGNLFFGAEVIKGSAYFISARGGAWDSNPKTELYQWNNELIGVHSRANYEVKFLTSFGAYFSSDESGLMQILGTTKNLNLPKGLLAEDEFCQIQTKVEEIFSYRFNTSYGDYSCMGGSLLESDLTDQKAELTPQFSTYSWINKESLLDLNWQKTFAEFDVQSGIIIGLGKNIGLWWNTAE